MNRCKNCGYNFPLDGKKCPACNSRNFKPLITPQQLRIDLKEEERNKFPVEYPFCYMCEFDAIERHAQKGHQVLFLIHHTCIAILQWYSQQRAVEERKICQICMTSIGTGKEATLFCYKCNKPMCTECAFIDETLGVWHCNKCV